MAKKQKKPKKTSKKYTSYDTSGGLKRKGGFCPKCGAGVFMAQHKNRATCGKCGYTEFKNKEPKDKE